MRTTICPTPLYWMEQRDLPLVPKGTPASGFTTTWLSCAGLIGAEMRMAGVEAAFPSLQRRMVRILLQDVCSQLIEKYQ